MKKQKNNLCACGCTQEVPDKWSYKANRPVIFIQGHNSKGRKLSDEARKKLRVIRNSEEVKTKIRAKLLGHPVTQETRRKISEANKRHWNDEKTGPRLRRNLSKAVILSWKQRKNKKL